MLWIILGVVVVVAFLVVMGVLASTSATVFNVRASMRECDCAWCHEERQKQVP